VELVERLKCGAHRLGPFLRRLGRPVRIGT
jgi:hypothetical protein